MKIKLYKYMPLEKIEEFGYLKNYLVQEIWLTPLNQFNDPFEGNFTAIPFLPSAILSNQSMFQKILNLPRVSRLESKEFNNSLLDSSPPLVCDDFFKTHGAICLTSSPVNLLMWSYYGKCHTGCCVEFELDFTVIQRATGITDKEMHELSRELCNCKTQIPFNLPGSKFEFVLLKIKYENKIPVIDMNKLINLSPSDQTRYIAEHSVGVKYTQWQHEDEYRIICNANSIEFGLLPLTKYAPFLRITGVIMGSLMENFKKQIVADIVKCHDARLLLAHRSKMNYSVEIKEYARVLDTGLSLQT